MHAASTMNAPSIQPAGDLAELVARGRRGDDRGFPDLVARFQAMVCAVAFAATGDRALSEDVAQETFLAAWRGIEQLRDPERLPGWLAGIARNLASKALRRRRERPTELPLDAAANDASPAETAAAREEQAMVGAALLAIPARYREPLVLFYREGQSVDEVARALSLSPATVQQRLSRGRRQLREAMLPTIEREVARTRPTARFTATVVAGLVALRAGTASAAAATLRTGIGAGKWIAAGATAVAVTAAVFLAPIVRSSSSEPTLPIASAAGAAQLAATTAAVGSTGASARRGARPPLGPLGGRLAGWNPEGDGGRTLDPLEDPGPGSARFSPGSAVQPIDERKSMQRNIDVDFLQAPTTSLMRLFSDVMEVPIVIEGEVETRVDLRVKNTPVIDALDTVLVKIGARRDEIPALRIISGGGPVPAGLGGEPVSGRWERTDVHKVLEVLGQHLELPIWVDQAVPPIEVTVAFDHTPAAVAFATVLSAAGLGVETDFAFRISPDDPDGP